MTSSNPISSSLPPLLPQEMSSILGDSDAVSALGGGGASTGSAQPAAFLDLSSDAVQLSGSQQIEMAELQDDAALFGGTVGSSSFASIEPAASPPVAPSYDPTQDPANPVYADPNANSATDWSQDLANPEFWG